MQWTLWLAAVSWALVGLSGIHFVNSGVLEAVFFSGFVGGMAMLPFTGVHGDFNVLGAIVYVTVNAIFFYYVFRLVRYLFRRVI
jgi:hypothetical protein